MKMRIDRPINYTGSDVSKGVRVQFPGTQGDTFIRFLTWENGPLSGDPGRYIYQILDIGEFPNCQVECNSTRVDEGRKG